MRWNRFAQEEGRGLDEQNLIREAASGNHDAFENLMLLYQSMVYRVCLKVTGSSTSAEDIAQEVFLKVYYALPEFRQDASFSSWLYQITVRKCLDWRRAESRARQRIGALEQKAANESTVDTPEGILVGNEQSRELLMLVNELREPYRTVTKMYYLEEQSYHQIATRTGLSVKTVESQLYRARRMLREKGGALQ